MSGRPSGCNHEDWPCCGCGEELSQEEQHEQFTELNGALDGLDAFEDDPEDEGTFGDGELEPEDAERPAAPMTDYEADTPLGQQYSDGFEPD